MASNEKRYIPEIILLLTLVWTTDVLANRVSKLMTAVQRGETALVLRLIDQIPIDSRDEYARTAVHYAVMHNQEQVLINLMAEGADINIIDADGKTPYDLYLESVDPSKRNYGTGIGLTLRMARAKTALDIVKELDKGDADNVLDVATGDIVKELDKGGADNVLGVATGKEQIEMLFKAAESGDREAVELFLHAGVDPKSRNDVGKFPFHVAVSNKHPAVAAILLKAIGGINQIDDKGWTPLHWAILARDWKMVRELMRAGAQFWYRPPSGYYSGQDVYDIAEYTNQVDLFIATAFAERKKDAMNFLMEKAAHQANHDLYQKLLDNDADLDILIEKAARQFNLSLVQKILDSGGDPNILMEKATSQVNLNLFQKILDNGADPNIRGEDGATPLIALVQLVTTWWRYNMNDRYDYLKLMHSLLDAGADPNATLNGETALDILSKAFQSESEHKNKSNRDEEIIATIREMILVLVFKADAHIERDNPLLKRRRWLWWLD